MQLSPLQLDELRFLNVRIDCRDAPDLREHDKRHEPYAFENTKFSSTIEHNCAEENPDQPVTCFVVTLSLCLPAEGENPPPYVVDVKCVGYFSISKAAFPDFERRYDVGVVNGASMLYGAMREMISTVTARSWYGQVLLPSLNFQNSAPSKVAHDQKELSDAKTSEAKKVTRRKKSAKSE